MTSQRSEPAPAASAAAGASPSNVDAGGDPLAAGSHDGQLEQGTAAVMALGPVAADATRAAALACQGWVGRGDGKAADGAATAAMRETLANAPGRGTVVIGEGEKDEAPMLHNGERLGNGIGADFDIAVDPLECTSFCAAGLPGALATIAVAEGGSLWSPGTALYMDKLVVGPEARDAIDIQAPPEENLRQVAHALGKRVEELTVVVLDKPRHEELIARLRQAGAAVRTPAEGDVAGALAALLPEGQADMLMGVGGTPEGAMTACAVAALGGGMQGRLAPQLDTEAKALTEAGVDTERTLSLAELVGGVAIFAATGVTGGELLQRPWQSGQTIFTESIVITPDAVRRIVERTSLADAPSSAFPGEADQRIRPQAAQGNGKAEAETT